MRIVVTAVGVGAALIGAALLSACEAKAQAPQIGATVNCNGNTGVITGTSPRPGWDEPFYIVKVPMGSSTYDLKCLPAQMRAVAGAPAAPPAAPPPPATPAPAPAWPAPAPPPTIEAPAGQVGATVNCNGNIGTIIGTAPRPGWDEPFSIVRVPRGSATYDLKCLSSQMRPVAAARPAPQPGAPETPPPADAPHSAAQCRPGAKLEGLKGNNWYEVTVISGPDAEDRCFVRFDGYGDFNNDKVWELRPRGSGPITRAPNPVPDGPNAGAPTGPVPDGAYICRKIPAGGGATIDVATVGIRGGRVTGLPAGWTVRSVGLGPPNAWSQTVASVNYQTPTGDTDLLECSTR